jgi:hypothetical protein
LKRNFLEIGKGDEIMILLNNAIPCEDMNWIKVSELDPIMIFGVSNFECSGY